MRKLLKKVFLTALALVILLSPLSPLALQIEAAPPSPWYNQTFPEWYNKVYNSGDNTEIFGERYTAAQVQWVIYSLLAMVATQPAGSEVVTCFLNSQSISLATCAEPIKNMLQLIADAFNKTKTSYYPNGDENAGFFATVFNDRPLSAVTYFKDLGRKFDLAPEAQAQTVGFGFNGLDPVRDIWRGARDITYVLFVFAIIAMSFMIMFRVKVSPQAIITVQSALPKIILAIILVTFSYAIAGFLVDMMYLTIGVISLLITTVLAPGSNPWAFYFGFLTQGLFGTGILGLIAVYFVFFSVSLLFTTLASNGIFGALTLLIPLLSIQGLLILMGVIVVIVMLIALIFITFRVIWMLLRTFAMVLLLTFVAPFYILIGLFVPNMGFGAWIRNYAGNLAVFPTVGLMIWLSYRFVWYALEAVLRNLLPPTTNIFVFLGGAVQQFISATVIGPFFAPALNAGWPPLLGFGGGNIAFIYLGVSAAIMFITPRTADMIKALISGQPFAYGTAIGEAFGPIKSAAQLGAKGVGIQIERQEIAARLGGFSPWIGVTYPRNRAIRAILDAIGRGGI